MIRNFVKIRTAHNVGSGVLLSCDVDEYASGKLNNDEKSYIVLTNYHVIQDINNSDDGGKLKDKKNNFRLTILDVNGNEIERNMIQHIYVESGNNYSMETDVAVLLVIIKDCCKVDCNNNVLLGNYSGEDINTYGYPYVLSTNWIAKDVSLNGRIINYTKKGMGLYKINDDYHSYSDISDKQLMEGLSGAPIYYTNDGIDYLVGINESVCNIEDGKNPFKIVYFIPIERVLTWLSNHNIILYKYNKGKIHISWIIQIEYYDKRKGTFDLEKPRNIVFIGGSGAGKSSIINTLCQHGESLGTVGDGQTTRMNIIYHLTTLNDKSRIEIWFKTKQEFLKNRINVFRMRRYEWIFYDFFEFERKNILNNPCSYFLDIINKFNELGINNSDISKQIYRMMYDYENNKDDDLLSKIQNLYEECIKLIFDKDNYKGKKIGAEKLEDLYYLLTKQEGFYNIEEFKHIFDKNEWSYLENLANKYIDDWIKHSNINDFENEDKENSNENKTMINIAELYYQELYDKLINKLQNLGIISNNLNEPLVYNLELVNENEKKIIERCVQKVSGESLSSIIEKIDIYDKYSDDYAYDLYKLNVRKLCIIDTRGYDHIPKYNKTLYFTELFNEIKGEKYGKGSNIDAIVYVKKLDSEKPTELQEIIPMILSLEQTSPIFCVFTALDQYVLEKKQIPNKLIWDNEFMEKWKANENSNEIIFPKTVYSLYDNLDISNKISMPGYKQERVIKFVQNHLMPYVSKYEVNDYNILSLNRYTLTCIFNSIVREEWDMHFISIDYKGDSDVGLQNAIKDDLELMFIEASRTNWEYRHHSTITANYRRIFRYDVDYNKRERDLGYNRTYIDRWDNLLEKGYTNSFLSEKGETIKYIVETYGVNNTVVYDLLARIKVKFITASMGIWDNQSDNEQMNGNDKEENNLRKYFQELYKTIKVEYSEGDIREYQIFKLQKKDDVLKNKDDKAKFLNTVCNFKSVLNDEKNKEAKNGIIEFIVNEINEYFTNNNEANFQKLYTYDGEFKKSVDYIIKIVKMYSDKREGEPDIEPDVFGNIYSAKKKLEKPE